MRHTRVITIAAWLVGALALPLSSSAFQLAPAGRLSWRLLAEEWKGEVVSNAEDGRIKGCSITPVGETEFTIRIDGIEADLGKFGLAVYKKITNDARQQRFQGFKPGTIPPHLLPTYKAFTMDEVAREAVLEAMQQNDIRPFESCRTDLVIAEISIPPRKSPQKKKKKRGTGAAEKEEMEEQKQLEWLVFDNMKDALKAGWEPGESFSFLATNCKGQKLKDVNTAASPSLATLQD
ncbi:hypothetical protein HJC23_003166 [Cyclotella cryptica]|uniref:Trigger factor ribosome-binding bacterial domain-containing protein n=1 Tax=Cyclotella cryptica TaxID=29204 RepID=A0ABD3PPE0_9STRA|eukprot:CCRYP_012834-RA/>CCRYP_012834-RA protein AED:0.04 eAED:0.04 QI:248/1/1/1/1/1/3/402/234